MNKRTENDIRESARRISRRFESRFHQGYVSAKIASDPVYPAALAALRVSPGPVLDIGCGLGLLGHFLREHGVGHEVLGIDADERKIAAARRAAAGIDRLRFEVADAREPLAFRGSVALLDLLHYFADDDQRRILENAASCARAGDVVVIRDCIRDGTWRYRLTWIEETFATSIGWLRGERLNFPTLESIATPFRARGFEESVSPLWGRTPFNNYVLTFRCR